MTDLIHDALNAMMAQSYERINGMATKLEQNIDVPCPACRGDGFRETVSGGVTVKCHRCHGSGSVMSQSGEV